MRFCTSCGRPLIRQWILTEARERDVCASCRTVHYDNPKILVACLVYWLDRIVLCRRAVDPAAGCWFPPTGFVESGETLEEAAVRELQEETGLTLSPCRMILYSVANLPHMNQIYVAFRAELQKYPKLMPGLESLDVRLFSESEIPFLELAFNEMSTEFLPNFFHRLRTSNFQVNSVTLRPVQEPS
jgi:ADP-ribose pyrophosphatase YjhB (NUDIX family)